MNDKKLSFTVNYPFNKVIEANENPPEGGESPVWCSIVDVFQTSAIDAQDDYKLKHLVEQFQLSGSLLEV